MNDAPEVYDLNLLRTFACIYETRSVTKAAEQLFVSQPSVSYALAKLRKMFHDELFIRGAAGLQPTPVAMSVYPQLRHSLQSIDSAVHGVTAFKPATSRHNFRLLLSDIGEIALLPGILRKIQESAPLASVEVLPLTYGTAREDLIHGKADAAICTPRIDSADLFRDQLLRQSYWGICSASHPRLDDAPQIDEFLKERQVVVNEELGHEHIQQRMRELNYDQTPAVRLPHFSALPHVLGTTDYLSIVPELLAQIFVTDGRIKMFKLPFSVPSGDVALYTYRRTNPAPAVDWLRATIRDALQQATG
jgi:DNA-binding transcriptional LysR family regulator